MTLFLCLRTKLIWKSSFSGSTSSTHKLSSLVKRRRMALYPSWMSWSKGQQMDPCALLFTGNPLFQDFTFVGTALFLTFKKGLVNGLLYRAWRLCSNYTLFHSEVLCIRETLKSNGYPVTFLDSCIKKFLDKQFTPDEILQSVFGQEPYLLFVHGFS